MSKTMLFNPYTGRPRNPLDIQSDPEGILMLDPDEPIRAALAAPQGEPVAWQYQWLNPGGGPVHDGSDDWYLLKPRDVGQSQQQCIDDMLAYRMHGQPVYAVRPLYAGQPIKGD